ncbi:hypothetical protein [Cylindrospermopsis raciborskii]|uniref:hypothetical protein n=1 Tax=Cylindrospermopsis raciborskii TaxID=77022 RepID=UPI002ED90EB0
MLKTRLGDIPETIAKGVDTISVLPILDELLKLAIKVDCFEDFHQSLLKLSPKNFESNESWIRANYYDEPWKEALTEYFLVILLFLSFWNSPIN